MDISERLINANLKGLCCSQTIMSLCLEDIGKENEDLVKAMAAFCDGMGEGRICGTLAAAVAVLYVIDEQAATEYRQEELMSWFLERYGGYDCQDIIHNDPVKRVKMCPMIVLETYVRVREYILDEQAQWPQ
jgi:hypothetical protein